jgi:tetratricopeptide (TPR) repeat protein
MEEQDYILFENYLAGDLSDQQSSDFENRLNTDQEFKQAFTIYQQLSANLEHEIGNKDQTADFKANLDTISHRNFIKQEDKENPIERKKTFNVYKLAIAASIALVMGFFAYNQFSGGANYSDFNTHDTVDFAVRNTEGNVGLLIKTTKAFNNKDYKKAKAYLEELLQDNPDNVEYNFYYAITNIELDNFAKAETILGDISQGSSAYNNKAKWYLALSKLKQQKEAECIKILKTIPEDADDYDQAYKLLNKIE